MPTFEEAAAKVLEQKRGAWRNPKHANDWPTSLRLYAFPHIGALPAALAASARARGRSLANRAERLERERGGKQGLCPVPDEPLPPIGTLGFRVQRYGMLRWGDLFTARQKAALVTLLDAVCRLGGRNGTVMACAFSRVAMSDMSCTRWNAVAEKMQHTWPAGNPYRVGFRRGRHHSPGSRQLGKRIRLDRRCR